MDTVNFMFQAMLIVWGVLAELANSLDILDQANNPFDPSAYMEIWCSNNRQGTERYYGKVTRLYGG